MRAAIACFLVGLLALDAMSQNIGAPIIIQTQFSATTGAPLALGKLCSYDAGTTNLKATFLDHDLMTQNDNPMILGAAGFPLQPIYLDAQAYKFVLRTAGTNATCSTGTVVATFDYQYDLAALYRSAFATKLDDKVCHASQYTGTTPDNAGGKLAFCMNVVLPSTGGTVAMSGLEGAQPWTACPFTGVTKPVVVIYGGSTISDATDCTIPDNVSSNMGPGAIINQAMGTTLTVNGPLVPSLNQHFAGAGSFAFGPRNPELYPQYWGAVADGSTNDYAASQATLDALETNGGRLLLTGNYLISGQRLIYASSKSLEVLGFGWDRSKITWVAPADTPVSNEGLLNVHGSIGSHNSRVRIEGIFFEGGSNRAAGYSQYKQGINIYNSDNVTVRGNHVKGFRAESIGLGNFGVVTEITDRGYNCWVEDNLVEDFAQDGINPNMNHCSVSHNRLKQGYQAIEAGIPSFKANRNDISDMTGNGIVVASIADFEVSGNVCRDCASTNQGFVTAAIYVVGNGRVEPATDGTITDNDLIFTSQHANQVGIAAALGTSTTTNSRISISINRVYGARVCVSPVALSNSDITANTCTATAGSTYGFVLSEANAGDTSANRVTGNYAYGSWSMADFADLTPTANANRFVSSDNGTTVRSSMLEPRFLINEPDATAGSRLWDIDLNGGALAVRTRTDADATGVSALTFTRNTGGSSLLTSVTINPSLTQSFTQLESPSVTVAANTVVKLSSNTLSGILFFHALTSTQSCIYTIAGANNTTVEIADPGTACGAAAAASNYNFYSSGGEYKFQNNTGGSEAFRFTFMGTGEH